MVRELDGSVVAVIGASGGLGERIAGVLARRGAQLVLVGRQEQRVRDASPLDTGHGGTVVTADITDPRCGDAIIAAAHGEHGRLDGVVNATGVVAFGSLADTPDEVVEELFLTNVIGPLWMLRRVIPALSDAGGFVTTISGMVASSPMPGMAPYSAAKAALAAASVALAKELRRAKISVTDVQPPHTETGLSTHPLSGQAPTLPQGLDPGAVAARIVTAIQQQERLVTPDQFS